MRISRQVVRCAIPPLLAATIGACHKSSASPLAPSQTTTTVPAAAPAITGMAIFGGGPLTSIGETEQLTATATFNDGTTKDVTSQGTWHWGEPQVLTVSPSGLVTVVGFGATWITVTYQTRGAGITIAATPSGTFALRGRVRQPAAGGVLGARVVETVSGRSGMTDVDGEFSIAQLPRLQAHLRVEREGYEPIDVDTAGTNLDLAVQRVVRLNAGESVTPGALAPHDLSYVVGGQTCDSCRLIRIVVSRAGTLHLHVTWAVAASRLRLFAEGQIVTADTRELTADVAVAAPREIVVYLGEATAAGVLEHTPFTLETSMRDTSMR
jgi:hypothetical protein